MQTSANYPVLDLAYSDRPRLIKGIPGLLQLMETLKMTSAKQPVTDSIRSPEMKSNTSRSSSRLSQSELASLQKLAKQRTKEILSLLATQPSQPCEQQVNDSTTLDSEKNTDQP